MTQNFETFAKNNGLTLSVEMIGFSDMPKNVQDYKDNAPWNDKASHYKCILRNGRKFMVLYFSIGSAIVNPPTVADILNCIALDSSVENMSFEEFCDEFGYDSDSIKANKIYKACVKQTEDAKRIGINLDKLREIDPL